MFKVPRPRREIQLNLTEQQVSAGAVPRQAGRLAVTGETIPYAPGDILAQLRLRLPAREQTDDGPFIDRHVDSVIETAIRNLAAHDKDIYDGRGAVVKLGVSHSTHLFEATAKRLTGALEAPTTLEDAEDYYQTMHDTTDSIEHLELAPTFRAYLDPAHVVEFLQSSAADKMAWIKQADGANELYLPTAAGAWIDIRSGHAGDATGRNVAAPHAPEILLVVPSYHK